MADLSKLGRAFAAQSVAPAPVASAASRFMAALSGKRPSRHVPIPIPGVGVIDGWVTLIGTDRELDIEGEVVDAMTTRKLEAGLLNETAWQLERAKRTLAEAIFEVDPSENPAATRLGTHDLWGRLPKETLVDLYRVQLQLAEEHDPASYELTEEDRAAIRFAVEKKSEPALRSFGVRVLARYLATTVDPPASSLTPKSPPGDSSPGS